MFLYTIDEKKQITDRNGNQIVDLASSIFSRNGSPVSGYEVKKLNSTYIMRPDLVSYSEYGSDRRAEFILKYTGVSNPFTLEEDDIVMIPKEDEVIARMVAENPDEDTQYREVQVEALRKYYKYLNQDFPMKSDAFDIINNTKIPSGVKDVTKTGDYIVPYISEDGTQAVAIRNGRMYFGENSGLPIANMIKASTTQDIDSKIQALIDGTATALSDTNCIYNGVTLADFTRSSINSNSNESQQQ